MVFFFFLCLTWVLLIKFLYQVRNYPGLILVLLVGAYELPGLALFYGNVEVPAIQSAQSLFGEFANADMIFSHVITLIAFFLSFAIASAVDYRRDSRSFANASEQHKSNALRHPSQPHLSRVLKVSYGCLAFLILVFGVVSVLQEEGLRRLDDYLGGDYEGLRVFSYGIGLLPVLTCFGVVLYVRGQKLMAAVILVAALPLLYEIFLTSRRQFFLPVFFVILLWRLYGSNEPLSWLSRAGVLAVVLVFFGLQYSLRERLAGNDVTIAGSVLEGSLAPQAGEFVAIGATSLYSYPLVETRGVTYGSQFAVTVLNAVPFAKLGNALFPDTTQQFADITSTVAPFGGLSMIAESYLSFGRTGVVVLGLLMAVLAGKFHRRLIDFYSRRRYSATNILFVSVGSVLLGKYRSGVSDAFFAFTSMSILFVALYLMAKLFNGLTSSSLVRAYPKT